MLEFWRRDRGECLHASYGTVSTAGIRESAQIKQYEEVYERHRPRRGADR